jgi:hypothetical protein
VGASSAIGVGDQAQMQADVVASSPVPWYFDGDTRYIFGANDPNAQIEISLGQIRQIDDIEANIDLPSQGDRPVIGPFSIQVSTDGTHWSSWGSDIDITGSTTDPLSISQPLQSVEYILFSFGPSGSYYGNFGGSAVGEGIGVAEVFATATPLPATWIMMLIGFVALGSFAYRGSKNHSAIAFSGRDAAPRSAFAVCRGPWPNWYDRTQAPQDAPHKNKPTIPALREPLHQ